MRYIKREWDTSVVIACECGCGVEEPVFIPEVSVCVLKERDSGIPRLEKLEMLVSALVKDAQYFGSAISRIDATIQDGLVTKDSENIIHTIPRNVMAKIRKLDMAVGRINTYLHLTAIPFSKSGETELGEKSDDE